MDDDLLLIDCAECDNDEHRVLRAADSGWTVQCTACANVLTVPAPPRLRMTEVPLILSHAGAGESHRIHVPLDEETGVDDELSLDGLRIRVTGIEATDGTRPPKAAGRAIRVLHAVRFETVLLRYTVNEGPTTRSFIEEAPPEEEVVVGTVREVQGARLRIKALKSDENRTMHRGYLMARHVARIFAEDADRRRERARARAREGPRRGARRA